MLLRVASERGSLSGHTVARQGDRNRMMTTAMSCLTPISLAARGSAAVVASVNKRSSSCRVLLTAKNKSATAHGRASWRHQQQRHRSQSAVSLSFRRRRAPAAAPVAALGPDTASAFADLVPHLDGATTLASQRIADLADAAVAMDAPSSFADAMQAVNASASSASAAAGDAVAAGPKRMEGILSPVSDRLEAFLLGTQEFFKEKGVPYPLGSAIIFTTFTVKALTYPFTKSQIESSLNMQNLQPQVDAVRKKYEGDTERMNGEINRLYQENQVSPLAGCVPILLTLPVVWGLYRAFNNASIDGSFDEPWFFIPSLAGPSPERTLDWLLPLDENFNPPIGWHDASLYLIVPVLTVASQYASMSILKPPKDPNDPKAAEKEEQQSVLLNLLPLFIGYISLTVPAGLALYWLFNNVFTTATQVYLRQGGGAVAKIEKVEEVKLKVPLGCAVVDLETMEQQSREEPFAGPYVIWGDASTSDADADADVDADVEATAGGAALAAAMSSSGFYTTSEERRAEAEKWAALLANRGKRPRNAADRQLATPDELRAVVADFREAGREAEAAELAGELERLEALGGDAYIARVKAEGSAARAAEEERAMREAFAPDPAGG